MTEEEQKKLIETVRDLTFILEQIEMNTATPPPTYNQTTWIIERVNGMCKRMAERVRAEHANLFSPADDEV